MKMVKKNQWFLTAFPPISLEVFRFDFLIQVAQILKYPAESFHPV
jgi:hypothetical protein